MSDQAIRYLQERGIRDERIIASSQVTYRDGRCWFPWFDEHGKQVYETGRAVNGTQEPRYKHSPGRKPALFASPLAWNAPRVALVEGQIDALLAEQAGTPAFATSGAQVSEASHDEIRRALERRELVILIPDNDEAGKRWRSELRSLLDHRVPLVEVRLPEGVKDLGELCGSASDPLLGMSDPIEQIEQLIRNASPIDRLGARPVEVYAAEAGVEVDEASDFLVAGLWRRQSILAVAGEEGDGKTLFSEQLLRQILRGDSVFDHFEPGGVRPKRILVVDTEMQDADVTARANEMDRRGLGVPAETLWWFTSGGIDLASREDQLVVEGEIRRLEADALWIDSGGNAVSDPTDLVPVKRFFNWCDQLLRTGILGIGITLHPRKRAQGEYARRFDDLFGSREWKGRISSAVYLEGDKIHAWKDRTRALRRRWPIQGGKKIPRARLERPGYDSETEPPFRITYTAGGLDDVDLTEVRSAVLALIADRPGQLTRRQVEAEVKGRAEFIRGVVQALVDESLLTTEGGDRRGRGAKLRLADHGLLGNQDAR